MPNLVSKYQSTESRILKVDKLIVRAVVRVQLLLLLLLMLLLLLPLLMLLLLLLMLSLEFNATNKYSKQFEQEIFSFLRLRIPRNRRCRARRRRRCRRHRRRRRRCSTGRLSFVFSSFSRKQKPGLEKNTKTKTGSKRLKMKKNPDRNIFNCFLGSLF